MPITAQIFKMLRGQWRIQRTIPNQGKMNGKASFVPIANEEYAYHYREQGIFEPLNSQESFSVYQEYIYRFHQGKISAYFLTDNRLFHTLDFDNQSASYSQAHAKHQCDPDTYKTTYTFYDDSFEIIHDVKGPAKNFCSTTLFSREEKISEEEVRATSVASNKL